LVKITIKIIRIKFDIKKDLRTHFGLIESIGVEIKVIKKKEKEKKK